MLEIDQNSPFSKITFFSSPSENKKKILAASLKFFEENKNFSVSQKEVIKKRFRPIIRQTLKNAHLKTLPKNEHELKTFIQELKEVAILVGSPLKLPACLEASPEIRAIYKKLLWGEFGSSEMKTFLKPRLASAILLRQDPKLMKEARELFGEVLREIAPQMEHLNKTESFSARSIIGNILSYYTYFGLENGEILSVPQEVEGIWKLVDYKVEKIFLTPDLLGSPITAFGLTPLKEKAPPLLLFKGTTIPTDHGAALSVLTDLNPFGSVGAYTFRLGKDNLRTWLEKENAKTGLKAQVFGQSLGGALTLHAAVNFPFLIETASAYAPPALLPYEIRQWNRLAREGSVQLPQVSIFYQENDIVPLTGLKWGEGWKIYRVYPSKSKNFFFSHMQCFLSQKDTLILKADTKMDERKFSRYFLAILHLTLSIPFFSMGVAVYSVYLGVRKTFELSKAIFHKKSR